MFLISCLIGLIIIILIFLVICIAGREKNFEAERFLKFRYAHRGLHNAERPENSLSAFKAAADKGYAIELDVHLMRDNSLAVIHDSSLKRTAGDSRRIEELTRAEIKDIKLLGIDEHIPTLREVLELVDGRVPLLIELKAEKNAKCLCSALMYELRDYKGAYCVESFDPRCLLWMKKNAPKVVRGQLAQNFLKNGENLSFPLRLILTLLTFNIATQPDFVAFRYTDRKCIPNALSKGFWQNKGFAWTITDMSDLEKAEKEGYAVIFEDIVP